MIATNSHPIANVFILSNGLYEATVSNGTQAGKGVSIRPRSAIREAIADLRCINPDTVDAAQVVKQSLGEDDLVQLVGSTVALERRYDFAGWDALVR
jgi:hypothetical protein